MSLNKVGKQMLDDGVSRSQDVPPSVIQTAIGQTNRALRIKSQQPQHAPSESLAESSFMSTGSFCDPFSDVDDDIINEHPGKVAGDGTSSVPISAPLAPPQQLNDAGFCTVSSWSENDDYDCVSHRSGHGCCQHSCSSSISSLGSPEVEIGNAGSANSSGLETEDDLMMVFETQEPSDPEEGRRSRGAPTVISCSTPKHLSSFIPENIRTGQSASGYECECDTDFDSVGDDGTVEDWESCDSVPTIEMNVEGCEGCSRVANEDMDGPHHVPYHDANQRQHHHCHRQKHQHSFPQTIHTFPRHRCHVVHHNASSPEADYARPGSDMPMTTVSTQAPNLAATSSATTASSGPIDAIVTSQASVTVQGVHTVERHTKILHLVPPRPDLLTLSFLPDEMTMTITSYLDVISLVALRETCARMRDMASRDEAGWSEACRRLWKEKANVCREARSMMGSGLRSSHRLPSSEARRYGAMGAYRVSVRDAAIRHEITVDELCYDGERDGNEHSGRGRGPIWSFRFKESAGPDWTTWDPWWGGGKARKMVFMRDGTVMQLVPKEQVSEELEQQRQQGLVINGLSSNDLEEESIQDEDSARCYVLRPVFSDRNNVPHLSHREARGHPGDAAPALPQDGMRGEADRGIIMPPLNNNAALPHQQVHPRPRIDMRWRFVSDPMDMPQRPQGAYIRLTVGGRDVPTYVVRRSPTGNWGFLLESCWGLYASFDLPRRRVFDDAQDLTLREENAQGGFIPDNAAAALVDGHMAVPPPPPPPPPLVPAGPMGILIPGARMRLRRTRYGGRWMNVDGIESEDEQDDQQNNENTYEEEDGGASMLDDAAMTVTNGTQWREALLYNYGAVTLPEGSGATEEFDRIWSESLRLGRARTNVGIR